MPKGWSNLTVPEIVPSRDGYCHPAQSKRTKCACGNTLEFGAHRWARRCPCGRIHRKAPGAAIAATGAQPVRPGGTRGCPGVADEQGPVIENHCEICDEFENECTCDGES